MRGARRPFATFAYLACATTLVLVATPFVTRIVAQPATPCFNNTTTGYSCDYASEAIQSCVDQWCTWPTNGNFQCVVGDPSSYPEREDIMVATNNFRDCFYDGFRSGGCSRDWILCANVQLYSDWTCDMPCNGQWQAWLCGAIDPIVPCDM